MWPNSPVAFPEIRRHVGTGETSSFRKKPKESIAENALYLDDNSFPKEIWSFALRNLRYGKKNPPNYSLARLLDHKDYNTRNFKKIDNFLVSDQKNLFAGLYTNCVNSFYVPTGFVKPTDHNSRIRQLLIQIVDKHYGHICSPLPYGRSFNLNTIEEKWQPENFSAPSTVGTASHVGNFLRYRNAVINNRLEDLQKRSR